MSIKVKPNNILQVCVGWGEIFSKYSKLIRGGWKLSIALS